MPDITKIPIGEGKLYLASVEDLLSGRLLGHAIGDHPTISNFTSDSYGQPGVLWQ